ncbi:MAG: nickel pincer cofactor biosynthesis protein LarC [Planctomycetaceae bacterium]|jgi:uncharacterized protein (TIGR00299 family) protein|nr:nickel pincer cofactor biosynthesis protein LarC [Planctomycetaceae bacterium]
MKIAYFDCQSGISGDMSLGAIIDLGVSVALLNDSVRSLLPHVCIDVEQVVRCGLRGTLAKVKVPEENVHRHLSDILSLIDSSSISDICKENASGIFRLLAEAESLVHGVDIEEVHFHEVGAADSITDIVGVTVGLEQLGVEQFRSSKVPTGCGVIEIAHGKCSIPAPATVELLRGIPIAASEVPFELTTPTGAAILKYYVNQFGSLPSMTIESIGVGAGSRDLSEQANILRILVGDLSNDKPALMSAAEQLPNHLCERHRVVHDHTGHRHDVPVDIFSTPKTKATTETVWVLETNIDDSTGEVVGHCIDCLWNASPLDVWTTGIQMKKQRPGVTLSILCRREQINELEGILFRETSTIGVRRWAVERTILNRESCKIRTPWGSVDAKRLVLPDGTERTAPEFESAKKLAIECGISVREILSSSKTFETIERD